MSKLSTSIASFLLTIGLAAPALAQDADGPSGNDDWAKFQGNRVGLEFDLLSTSADLEVGGATVSANTLSMGLTAVAQIKLLKNLYLDAELPFAYGSSWYSASDRALLDSLSALDQRGFTPGNPTIGAHYAVGVSPDIAAFVGGSVSIPIVADPSVDSWMTMMTASAARAYFDMHRMLPETLSIRPRGGVEVRILPMLRYRGDLGVTVAIPTGDGLPEIKTPEAIMAERDTEIFIEQGNELELRTGSGFGGGLRFQAVFMPTQDDEIGGVDVDTDVVQTAIEPFVGYEAPGLGLYGRAGLLVALDESLGFGLDDGKVATVRLSVGGKF